MSVMKSQKAAENSQNRKTNDHRGFIVLQTQLASFESRNYQVILDSYWSEISLLYNTSFIDQVFSVKMAGY